jgi:hypothetical protein
MQTVTYTASDLQAVIPQLPAKDVDFALSLVTKAKKYGISEKQAYWIDRLTKQAKGELNQARPQVEIGSLTAVAALFAKAGEHLAHPKIMLRVSDGMTPEGVAKWKVVKLNVAGERAKVPGSINVASEGKYGEATWYGRITQDGKFSPSGKGQEFAGLVEALQALAKDPAGVAAEYGRWRGACCFCSRQLDDERSTEVGYGPTCAEHYGLPWGTKKLQVVREEFKPTPPTSWGEPT